MTSPDSIIYKPTKTQQTWNFVAGAILTIAIILLVMVATMVLYPYNPIEYNTETNMVLNEGPIYAGDEVLFLVDYCKTTPVAGDITLQLIDGSIVNYPVERSNVDVGCHRIIRSVKIPSYVPSGEYYIKSTVEYDVNHFKTITSTINTDKFIVINKDEIKGECND